MICQSTDLYLCACRTFLTTGFKDQDRESVLQAEKRAFVSFLEMLVLNKLDVSLSPPRQPKRHTRDRVAYKQ